MSNNASSKLDIATNRRAKKYSSKEIALRLLWSLGRLFFRFTPRPVFGVRRVLLRLFGATVGKGVNIYPTVDLFAPWKLKIDDYASIGEHAIIYNLADVQIGAGATISKGAHLCGGTHDLSDPAMKLIKKEIHIGAMAWVCADAFVGPGVSVGEGAVVGARAVAVKSIDAWAIVAGNPAAIVGTRSLQSGDDGQD